jgi:diguanylate cyclase (GGDEF)-like protein/PAS domain S-box-containing protein
MRILIAEDSSGAALILRRTLEKLGHEVSVAADGAEAWEILQRETFPLVISDWMMPRLDGPSLCRRIRAQEGVPYTYVILLTSRNERQDRIEGLYSGADDFLAKPLGHGELFARLEIAQRILTMQGEMRTLNARLDSRNQELGEQVSWLGAANHRFSELFAGLPVACYSLDAEGAIHEWNRAAVELFGYGPEEIWQRPIWDIFAEEGAESQARNIQEQKQTIQRVLAGEELIGVEVTRRGRDGRWRHLLSSTLPLRAGDGRVTGLISANADITERRALEERVAEQLREVTTLNEALGHRQDELARANSQLEQANARLEELATCDGLTGLKNHRFLQDVLLSNFSFARRHRLPLSLVMLDVDHFKAYNDTFGHPAGDAVLRQVALLLKAGVRDHDIAARYGGEEFAVLLPATAQGDALVVAQRLRGAVEAFTWEGRPVRVSVGVSTYDPAAPPLAATPGELMDQADAALYRSKQQGRNRVTHAHEMPAPVRRLLKAA